MTKDQLQRAMPYASPALIDRFYQPLLQAMVKYQINTPKRIAAFLAQLAHESGSLRYVKELASGAAYEGRKDLGNTQPGDGVKYKGRGLIQITGRSNYKQLSEALNVEFINNPELLETPEYATMSAAWFWNSRDLNTYADKPDEWTTKLKSGKVLNSFEWITYRINGGFNGMQDRLKYYNRNKLIFGA